MSHLHHIIAHLGINIDLEVAASFNVLVLNGHDLLEWGGALSKVHSFVFAYLHILLRGTRVSLNAFMANLQYLYLRHLAVGVLRHSNARQTNEGDEEGGQNSREPLGL